MALCLRPGSSRAGAGLRVLTWPPGLRAHSCPSQGLEQDVLQAIDRAIEAVHNAAVRDGGSWQPGAARGPPVSVLGASQWARGWVLPRTLEGRVGSAEVGGA